MQLRVRANPWLFVILIVSFAYSAALHAQGFRADIRTVGDAPDDYRLPVIYVLDADTNLNLVEAIAENLHRADVFPPVLLVGIDLDDRLASYTPTRDADEHEASGQAATLIEFISGELNARLEDEFSLSEFRVIHGHSISGLFAIHAARQIPHQINGVIAIGPSLWWDGAHEVETHANFCAFGQEQRIFLSLANEISSRPPSERLAQLCPEAVSGIHELSEDDHITALTPATHAGLRDMFSGWAIEPLIEAGDAQGLIERRLALEAQAGGPVYFPPRLVAQFARTYTQDTPETAIALLEPLFLHSPDHLMVSNFLGEAYMAANRVEEACVTYANSRRIAEDTGSPMLRWVNQRMADCP